MFKQKKSNLPKLISSILLLCKSRLENLASLEGTFHVLFLANAPWQCLYPRSSARTLASTLLVWIDRNRGNHIGGNHIRGQPYRVATIPRGTTIRNRCWRHTISERILLATSSIKGLQHVLNWSSKNDLLPTKHTLKRFSTTTFRELRAWPEP